MVFPYGIGVGDFIRGIETVITICKASREAGGASDEYNLLCDDLKSFEEALKTLNQNLRGAAHSLEDEKTDNTGGCEVVRNSAAGVSQGASAVR